ncbi:6-bladed beta-propeller [Runella rosea]|nr:6-bladed beta-propeller [Runella rosea]
MGRFTCLASVNTNSLICYEGNSFRYHLHRIGGGMGEYLTLHAFAIDTLKNELMIYDRTQFKVCYYDLKSGNFKCEQKYRRWVSNIEFLDAAHQVITMDYDEKSYLQVVDREFNHLQASLATEYPLITDAVFPASFSYIDSSLYYAEPFNEVIYRITNKAIVPYLKIDFGTSVFPKTNWKSTDTEQVEQRLQKGEYAFMVNLVSERNNVINFFHYYTPTSHHLVRYNQKTGHTEQFKNVSEEIKENSIPFPMACYQNMYLKPVYPDELNRSNPTLWWNRSDILRNIPVGTEANTILLLNYRLAQ